MRRSRHLAFAVLVVVGLGCSSIPDTSRTGRIHDVKIMESQVQPADIHVRLGDEIRWLNYRRSPTRIIFLQSLDKALSCARGGWGSDMNEATLKGNKAASLCFSKPGEYPYMARMEAEDITGGEIPVQGTVRVE